MKILALDPSGNFDEGKGCTGWAIFDGDELIDFGEINAEKFKSKFYYYTAHLDMIDNNQGAHFVIEDYLLYAHKANSQTMSRMETPKLLGILEYHLEEFKETFKFQRAVDVKNRWADKVLIHKGYLEKSGKYLTALGRITNRHERDAIRHGVHYITKLKKEGKL